MLKLKNTCYFLKISIEFVVNLLANLPLLNQKKKSYYRTHLSTLCLGKILVFLGIFFLYLCFVNESDVQVHFRDFLKMWMLLKIPTNFTVLLVRCYAFFWKLLFGSCLLLSLRIQILKFPTYILGLATG